MYSYLLRKDDHGHTTLELYVEHPEVGPAGTPGRGPYCIRWEPVPWHSVNGLRALLAEKKILPLDASQA